jgi:hypothetical protein
MSPRVHAAPLYQSSSVTTRRYYYIGSQRIALRENTDGVGAVYFFLADHLGSTAVTVDSEGNLLHELRYKPFGGVYYTYPGQSDTPADYYRVPRHHRAGSRFHPGTYTYIQGMYPLLDSIHSPLAL